jgi:outer membrane lipoprotein-sorting protein
MKVFLFIFLLLYLPVSYAQQVSCKEIIERMIKAIDETKTLSFNMKQFVRINNSIKKSEFNARIQVNPRKIYLQMIYPKEKIELLYNSEKSDKVLVKPNSFPFIPIELDPYSNLLREDNHHTIFELGFTFMGSVIKQAIAMAGKDFDKYFECKGTVNFEGRDCYAVIINFYEFKFIDYTVKPGETLRKIAQEKKISEHMILENNPKIKDFNDVKPGQVIKIPNGYAKKTILYIDKEHYLPIMMSMFDDKGLYERFEYRNLIVNPKFSDTEFTRNHKDYGF